MLLKQIHPNLGASEAFLLQYCTQRFFTLELGRLKSLVHFDNKLDQIAWVLCAWGGCCNEAGKHLEKPDSPLYGICMMLGCEMEEWGTFPQEIILC